MTREEEIVEFANSQVDCEFFNEELYKGIITGAKWADENPNLYSDEKYQTIKLSQLDELNKKAKFYDEVVEILPNILEFYRESLEMAKDYNKIIIDNMIQELQEKLEE